MIIIIIISLMPKMALMPAYTILINKDESSYRMEHFSFRQAVINVCPVLVSSELLLMNLYTGWNTSALY